MFKVILHFEFYQYNEFMSERLQIILNIFWGTRMNAADTDFLCLRQYLKKSQIFCHSMEIGVNSCPMKVYHYFFYSQKNRNLFPPVAFKS